MNIVANQRALYLAQAQHDAHRAVASLRNLPEAERFAVWALIAARALIPADAILLTEEPEDGPDAARILDGVLKRGILGQWSWATHAGCEALLHPLKRTEPR